MAVETKNATLRSLVKLGTNQVKAERAATIQDSTVEVAAAASATSVYTFFRIPSRTRITGLSRVAWDDLASTGAPTLDIGLKAVDGNVTTDVDCLNDGLALATASATSGVPLVKGIENFGKLAYEYLGLTTDPGGFLDVIGTILDADTDTGGTVTMTMVTMLD